MACPFVLLTSNFTYNNGTKTTIFFVCNFSIWLALYLDLIIDGISDSKYKVVLITCILMLLAFILGRTSGRRSTRLGEQKIRFMRGFEGRLTKKMSVCVRRDHALPCRNLLRVMMEAMVRAIDHCKEKNMEFFFTWNVEGRVCEVYKCDNLEEIRKSAINRGIPFVVLGHDNPECVFVPVVIALGPGPLNIINLIVGKSDLF